LKAVKHRNTKRSTMTKMQTTNGVFVPSQATGEIPMQAMQPANPWLALPSETAEFETLEPGSYNGVCIGITLREFPNYNDRNVMDQKVQFVFQICEGGQQYYLKSKPCKIVLNEKSNLYLLINSWTKATLERMAGGFSCDKMVGYGAQIVVNQREYNGKTYADIANLLPLRKGVKVPVTSAEIPAFLAKGAIAQLWAPGITVKDEVVKADFPQQAAPAAEENIGIPSNVNDHLPGFVPQQGKKAPKMPANAQVTQNQNPAEFMGLAPNNLQVTNPAPQPAGPDVVTASQAMAQEGIAEDDDDSDLPF